MEKQIIQKEEAYSYTVKEFIRATRPDGFGHIYVDGLDCGGMSEVLCDSCNKEILQPEDEPGKLVVHLWENMAWCQECFERWVVGTE